MSSGLHLSRELHDLVKSIGEARSKQEEDNLIRRDIIDLKKKVEKLTGTPRELKERALRAIYAEMMGHDIEFTHFFIVNLCQNKTISVKRAGYLAATLLLREDNQFIIMLVATLQKDLLSTSTYDILIALNTLCKLMSGTMVGSFVEIIERLLGHANTLIRKKAYCVYQKILQTSPGSCTNHIIKIKDSLADDNASVMGVGLNLIHDQIRIDPSKWKDITKQLTSQFCQVLDHKLHKDYDFQRLPAPWFQIRFLQIFSLLGKNDKKVSGELYDAVEKALKRADDTITDVGFAVTYQCVKTITQLYPNPALLDKASKTIARFFSPIPDRRTNPTNLKYLGIEAMRALVETHPTLASEHQLMIVDCLEHPDESIRRVTLELLYKTTNSNNLEVIIEKMVKTLKSTWDERLKRDLVYKIYELNERLAPDPEWFVHKTNILFQYGSECISSSMLARTVKTIEANLAMADDQSFGSNLIQVYYDYIQQPLPDVFIKLIARIYGEVGSVIYADDPSSLEQIGFQLRNLLEHKMVHADTKNWIYSALAKIKACPNFSDTFIAGLFEEAKTSDNYEIRQRAHEYSHKTEGIVSIAKIAPYDANLTFLKDFIEAAIKKGARKYDSSKVGVSGKINSAMKSGDLGLLTTHRQADLTGEPGNGGQVGADENITLAKGGQKIFGTKKIGDSPGLPKKAEPLNFSGAGSGDTPSKFIGTTTAPVKAKEDPKAAQRRAQAAKIFGGTVNIPLFGTSAKQTITIKPFGPTTTARPTNGPQPTPKTKPTPTANTGNSLFGTPPANKPAPVKPKAPTANPLAKPNTGFDLLGGDDLLGGGDLLGGPTNPQTKPAPVTQPAPAGFDIFDMDFNDPSPVTNKPESKTNTGGDLLGFSAPQPNFSKPVQVKSPVSQRINEIEVDIFGGENTVGAPEARRLMPFIITTDKFEELWGDFGDDALEHNKKTCNVRNQKEFGVMCQSVGFAISETIENDNICSGKYGDEIILFYGTYKLSGQVDCQVKSRIPVEGRLAMDKLIAYMK
jgi:hypothetical protein